MCVEHLYPSRRRAVAETGAGYRVEPARRRGASRGDMRCATAQYLAEVGNTSWKCAAEKLARAWRLGAADRYHFGTAVVYCERGADLVIPLKSRGGRWVFLTPRDVLDTLAKMLRGFKSRRAAVKIRHICNSFDLPPSRCSGVAARVLEAAGVEIATTSDGPLAVVHDVAEFMRRTGNVALTPDRPSPPPPRRRRVKREKMTQVSVHLPPEWLGAIDMLVSRGRYGTRGELVREALGQMLERYRTCRGHDSLRS